MIFGSAVAVIVAGAWYAWTQFMALPTPKEISRKASPENDLDVVLMNQDNGGMKMDIEKVAIIAHGAKVDQDTEYAVQVYAPVNERGLIGIDFRWASPRDVELRLTGGQILVYRPVWRVMGRLEPINVKLVAGSEVAGYVTGGP